MSHGPWSDLEWKAVLALTIFGIIAAMLLVSDPAFPAEVRDVRSVEGLAVCDGEEVAVTGWVQSVTQKKGRLGSNYLEIKVRLRDGIATVFSDFPVFVADSRATFIGRVHSGRFGGFIAPDHHLRLAHVWEEW